MNFEMFIYKSFSKKYNKILKATKDINITELRSRVRILVVDDEEYDVVTLLKIRGYNVFYKTDIYYVEESEPFDIIILDIKGVGKRFASPLEGFGYAKEIKLKYPHKMVFCYSGTSDVNISEQLKYIDGFIKKDTNIDNWSNKLDENIKTYSDVNYHWNIIKNQLEKAKIAIKDINEIEKLYKESYNNDEFDYLKNSLMNKIKDANIFLNILQSLTTLIKLFAH